MSASKELILGLFFSNEDNLVFEKIKLSESLSQESKDQLKMLSFKFLGPVFLTAASGSGESWKIEFIESSLLLRQGRASDADMLQSFFTLNSSIESEMGVSNLFTLIGSQHTEDIKIIYDELIKYIHPSILQGRIVNKSKLGREFREGKFIQAELTRGLDLIEYSLGTSRKMYWEEQQDYYCIGIIERISEPEIKTSNLFTFDKDSNQIKEILHYIPSFYVLAILPEYYDGLVDETLKLFEKTSVFPNIRRIKVSQKDRIVRYIEEFEVNKDTKISYGVILIPDYDNSRDSKNISFFRKNLRIILDQQKELSDIIIRINPEFKLIKWDTTSNEGLNKIRDSLDSNN